MPPRFAPVVAPKCKRCHESVYPMERIDYDQGTWHQLCFKCLQCKSTLSMSAVAMIKGDLYCKNCFKRIFMKEGKYSSFDVKHNELVSADGTPLTAAEVETANAAKASSAPTTTADAPKLAAPTPIVTPAPAAVTTKETIAVIKPMTVSSSTSAPSSMSKPTSASSSASSSAVSSSSSSSSASSASVSSSSISRERVALMEAVSNKDVKTLHQLLGQHGADILFHKNEKGATVLETVYSDYRYKFVAHAIDIWLQTHIQLANEICTQHHIVSPLAGTDNAVPTTLPSAQASPAPISAPPTTSQTATPAPAPIPSTSITAAPGTLSSVPLSTDINKFAQPTAKIEEEVKEAPSITEETTSALSSTSLDKTDEDTATTTTAETEAATSSSDKSVAAQLENESVLVNIPIAVPAAVEESFD